MKKKRFVFISIMCMLFVALSFDIAIKKANYARTEIKIETNVNDYDFINVNTETEEAIDNAKILNDESFKLKNDIAGNYSNTTNSDTKINKSTILKKVIISSTFALKAAFLYFDICLKEKLKSKHDDCTYKVITNAYTIKEIKKD